MHANAPIGCQENCREMRKEQTPKTNLGSPQCHHQLHQTQLLDSAEPPSPRLKAQIPCPFPQFPRQPNRGQRSQNPPHNSKLHKYLKISEMQQRSSDAKTPPPIQHQNAALPTTIQQSDNDPAIKTKQKTKNKKNKNKNKM